LIGIAVGLVVVILLLSGVLLSRMIWSDDEEAETTTTAATTSYKSAVTTTAYKPATTAATTTAYKPATTAATTTAYTPATTTAYKPATTAEKPKKLKVKDKTWTMNSNIKKFTITDKNTSPLITCSIEDKDIIAEYSYDKKKNNKYEITLYAKKSGKTKVTITDYSTGESVKVKVNVNLKKNKYLYIESNSITLKKGKTYHFKIRNYYDKGSQMWWNAPGNNKLSISWPKEGWESGKEFTLNIKRGSSAVSGDTAFFVLKDDETKESAFVEVYIQ